MRRLLALAAASIVALSLLAAPAHALPNGGVCSLADFLNPDSECDKGPYVNDEPQPLQIHARKCYDHHRKGSNGDIDRVTFCAMINTNQLQLQSRVEALIDFINQPYPVDSENNVRVFVDWIRLISQDSGAVLQDYSLDTWVEPYDGDMNDLSTDWWNVCGNNDQEHVYAKARYRITWKALPGDPVGTWKTLQSGTSLEHCPL